MVRKKLPTGRRPSERPGWQSPVQSHAAPDDELNDIRAIAIHEAGHAVAATVLGMDLRKVDILRRRLPDGTQSLGFTECPVRVTEGQYGRDLARSHIMQTMAGPMAEMAVNSAEVAGLGAFENDRGNAIRCAAMAVCELEVVNGRQSIIRPEQMERKQGEIDALCEAGVEDANLFIVEHWASILAVADALLKRRSLTGAEVAAIVANAARTPEAIGVAGGA